jgi:hypothetical protein
MIIIHKLIFVYNVQYYSLNAVCVGIVKVHVAHVSPARRLEVVLQRKGVASVHPNI